jgi:hypothetical protein
VIHAINGIENFCIEAREEEKDSLKSDYYGIEMWFTENGS